MTGALFYDQSMGIAIALFASLAVSMIVLPVYFKVLYQRCTSASLRRARLWWQMTRKRDENESGDFTLV